MGDVVRIPILQGLGAKREELKLHSEGLLCARPGLDPTDTKTVTCSPSRGGGSLERGRGCEGAGGQRGVSSHPGFYKTPELQMSVL